MLEIVLEQKQRLEALESQLALSTERDAIYRRALEESLRYIQKDINGVGLLTGNMMTAELTIRQALSSSPAPEPVTVEEVEITIETAWAEIAKATIASGKMYKAEEVVSAVTAALLTKFKIERKG